MKFTAQEEYGMRCLLEIAREPSGTLTIPEIAEREGLTIANAGKLMRVLRQAGLVKSSRGQKGGYQLARSPEQLNVGYILQALGGRLYNSEFCGKHTGSEAICVHNVDCSIRSLWVALDAVIDRALRHMTLQDLLCSEGEMSSRVQTGVDPATFIQIGAGHAPIRTAAGVAGAIPLGNQLGNGFGNG